MFLPMGWGMENYQGIKFYTRRQADDFAYDDRLGQLNSWAYIFGELGLAPVHSRGAYGNHSYREREDAFVITCTGMIPDRILHSSNYCRVRYQPAEDLFDIRGSREPSSESFLHLFIYQRFAEVNCVMHGHSRLLNSHAASMGLAVTAGEWPYGTRELGQEAVDLLARGHEFIILKNHGFVATGGSIRQTARRVLHHYGQLVERLADMP